MLSRLEAGLVRLKMLGAQVRRLNKKKIFRNKKGFGYHRSPLRELAGWLALDPLDARIQLECELIKRDGSIPGNVGQTNRRRIVILLDHLGLNEHATVVNPNLDVLVARGTLWNNLEMLSVYTAPQRLLLHILRCPELAAQLSRSHVH